MKRPPVVSIRTTVRGPVSRVPFEKIACETLSERYDLSLVVCGDTLARQVNKRYRQKTYAPNVLSFPLGTYEGEMFLNVESARREARKYKIPLQQRLALLFVHGCLHLKGLRHGRTMESEERQILSAFGYQWHGESTQASTSAPTT